MDFQVRDARLTDVERIMALLASSVDPLAVGSSDPFAGRRQPTRDAANLLRQLIYLPQAAVIVAESGRRVVGFAVLALRPSVRAGGMIGAIDVLAVQAGYDEAPITDAMVSAIVRSSRNKGCTALEADRPVDADALRRWRELGFETESQRIVRSLATLAAARN